MRVLRAILGRFARLLVRIARTLDPGAAATPYRAAPARMAVLRQRYPGAPDHWLRLLAQRTSLGDDGADPGYAPPPAARRESPEFAASDPPPPDNALRVDLGRPAPRPAPRFLAPANRARAVIQAAMSARGSRRAAEAPRDGPRRTRPALTFDPARGRNPLARLLRSTAPSRTRDTAAFADAPPAERRRARDEQAARFPALDQPATPHEWIGPSPAEPAEPTRDAAAGWPEFRFTARPEPGRPTEPPRRARPDPRFAPVDDRWPELPAFADEPASTGLRASDEAALLAEQIGGKWSA